MNDVTSRIVKFPNKEIELSESPAPVSTPVDPEIKPKGHALPGIDYGLDILEEKPQSSPSPSPPPLPPQPQLQQPQQLPQRRQPSPSLPLSPQLGQSQHPAMKWMPPQPQLQPQPQSQFNSGQMQGYPGASAVVSANAGASSGVSASASPSPSPSFGSGSPWAGHEQGSLLNPGYASQMDQSDPDEEEELSYEEIRSRKIKGIATFRRLKAAGYVPAGHKEVTMTSNLKDIEDVVERLVDQRDLDNSLKFQRKILMGFCTLAENACSNKNLNIFELNLKGWSDNVYENLSDYDDVFEELHYKYKDTMSFPPELKLLGLVGGSAYIYHMSRDTFAKAASNVPGFNEVMSRDPELRRRYQNVATGMARENTPNQGIYNIISNQIPQPPSNVPPHPQRKVVPSSSPPPIPMKRKVRTRVPMSDPDDVDGLLGSLTNPRQQQSNDEIDLSELESLSGLI